MRGWFPFSDYDFFGYLAVGGGLLLAFDNVLHLGWISRTSWTWVEIVAVVGGAYAVGQLIAAISHRILETWVVSERRAGPIVRVVFSRFVHPLPAQVQQRIRDQAAALVGKASGETLFVTAHSSVHHLPDVQERLGAFLGRYGLFRNATVAGIVAASAWVAQAANEGDPSRLWPALASALFAVVCFGRYLTFHRHFAWEVLTSFAFRLKEQEHAR